VREFRHKPLVQGLSGHMRRRDDNIEIALSENPRTNFERDSKKLRMMTSTSRLCTNVTLSVLQTHAVSQPTKRLRAAK